MERNSLSETLVSSFCRICTTNNDVEWSIYETLNEDERTNLHMMLVKLYPTVFNESQVLCDEALKWPMKICKECKAKVIESYRFYELCIKSARSLRTIALKEQSTIDTLQDEKDDLPAVIKTEFIEFEEPTLQKVEYDSDDHSSAYNSPTEDVFGDSTYSLTTPTDTHNNSLSANKMQQKQCIKSGANFGGGRKRKTVSDLDRAKIIFAFEKGVLTTEISKTMQINRTTVSAVISKYRKTGVIQSQNRGRCQPKKLKEIHISRIRALRKENSRLPLKTIQQKLIEEFGILVSKATISRGLEKVVKKVTPAADVFSSEEFLKKFNS